jgi:NTE family protein
VSRRTLIAAVVLLAAACAHAPLNQSLPKADITTGYRYANMSLPRGDDGLFVVLTFSGGGSRAAGFAYGVLREIEKVTLADGSRLIDRIDVISSVSGGSFTSMYFGLHGPQGLDSFKTRFLDQNVEGMLFKAAASPSNIVRLLSPHFSRIDLAAEVYDRVLFDKKTYADLKAVQAANRRPFIVANSTELDLGSRFEWTQDQFDPICSDLEKSNVSRAVAASSAFPVLLTPMVLRSYTGEVDCGYKQPRWVANARQDLQDNPVRHRSALELLAYLNPDRQWLHIMDGGIADNIGLRGTLHAMSSTDTWQMDDPARVRTGYQLQGPINLREIKKLLVIVVNAATESDLNFDKKQPNPKLAQILGAISFTPMKNFSFDTLQSLLQTTSEIQVAQRQPTDCQNAARGQCPELRIPGAGVPPVQFYPVILGFSGVEDPNFRQQLNGIGTNFALKPGQLELLERAATDLLSTSDAWKQFLTDTARP